MTSRRDDAAEEPTASSDQPTETNAAEADGQDRPDGATGNGVPGLPADSVGPARDSAAASGSATSTEASAAPASAGPASSEADSAKPADPGPASAPAAPAANGAASATRGSGRPSDATSPGIASSAAGAPAASGTSPAEGSSAASDAAPAAASFVWDSAESSSTSSPARNFLRSSVAKASAASKRAVTAVDPGASSQSGSAGHQPPGPAKRSARQAHLTVARIEPWSVMKFSFVVSLVAFVILFVAVSILYGTLAALGVFDSLQHTVQSLTSSQDSTGVNAGNWFTASRVLGYTALLGSLNIVLITAMSTIAAVIYNLTSRLIGGVEVTLRETE